MDENRPRRIRAPYQSSILIKFPNREIQGLSSRDISMSGIFIESKETFALDEECLLVLKLSGDDPEYTLNIKSKVARITKDGVGLIFLEMESDSFVHLRNIIKFNVNNPEVFFDQCKKRPGFKG
ncbi:MAG: PilZ domain-containing protein [Pseudomonadota bacterium]